MVALARWKPLTARVSELETTLAGQAARAAECGESCIATLTALGPLTTRPYR
jgi:hypothetical protein